MSQYDLTICSVSFHSQDYLRLNWQTITYLNQNSNWQWIIVDNTPEESGERIDIPDSQGLILPRVEPDMTKPASCRGSYHHAAALNKAIEHVKTRFVLILDPDFYIVRKDWIDEVLTYMVQNNLSFFGAPWHPKWRSKYRYFPCVHCLFIDLDKIPALSLDFMPEIHLAKKNKKAKNKDNLVNHQDKQFNFETSEAETLENQESNPIQTEDIQVEETSGQQQTLKDWFKQSIPPSCLAIAKQIMRAPQYVRSQGRKAIYLFRKAIYLLMLKDRKAINSSPDTGYKLYRLFAHKPAVKNECIVPVYRVKTEHQCPRYALTWPNAFVERFLPDRLCHIPRRSKYFIETGFREQNYPDVSKKGWEEFFWQDQPFGFHLRCHRQDKVDLAESQKYLVQVLTDFIDRQRNLKSAEDELPFPSN